MNINIFNTTDPELHVDLSGEMDALGCSKIRSTLEEIKNKANQTVILNIIDVSFIDSSGIGAIVFLFKRLKEQGREMKIIGVQGQPQELMKLLRISSAIPVTLAEDMTNTGSIQNA
jgi:anti-anti-sigma factor